MRLAIVGGKLQGTEAAYLAGEAGYEVVLIDRRAERPAAGLAAEVHVFDVTTDPARTREVLLSCDAVLPACEDDRALQFLSSFVPRMGLPLLFDFDAYAVTQSKLRSNALFERLGVPCPLPWPRCGFPVVVKPSVGSGSTGVQLVSSEPGLALARAALAAQGAQAVIEELVAGPSLSIEVIAFGGEALTLLPTFLEFDAAYDCKRVVAPVEGAGAAPGEHAGAAPADGARWPAAVSAATLAALDTAARRLAEGVALGGVMDVEVMVAADGTPKVIEIDARLPSQTPAAVYHASDANIVALLAETVAAGRPPVVAPRVRRGAVYEHVLVEDGRVEVLGEHIVGGAGPLRRCDGLYGADVVLTDRPETGASRGRWVARLADEHGLEIAPESAPAYESACAVDSGSALGPGAS